MPSNDGLNARQRRRLQRYKEGISRYQDAPAKPEPSKVPAPKQEPKPMPPPSTIREPSTGLEGLTAGQLGNLAGAVKTLLNFAPDLKEGERQILKSLLGRYKLARKEAKEGRDSKNKVGNSAQGKKHKPRPQKAFVPAWKAEREKKIADTHKVSGYRGMSGPPLQGGAPGLGKKS
jgi:hypothetical protein